MNHLLAMRFSDFLAEANSGNNSTYQEWRRNLAANTWTDDVSKQQRIPGLLQ